jgi:serine/threonine protein kinase
MLKNCGLKENIPRTTFISKNSTPVGTPLQFQKTIEWVERKMNKNDYKYIHQIGSGGFGSVWKVRNKQNGEILAMK